MTEPGSSSTAASVTIEMETTGGSTQSSPTLTGASHQETKLNGATATTDSTNNTTSSTAGDVVAPILHRRQTRSTTASSRNVFKIARQHVAFDLPAVKTKKRSDLVFLPTGTYKPWWDLLVVLLVIYSAFSLPLLLCFDNIGASRISAIASWDLFVDVIFYLDVIFYFFTAYEQNGMTIYSHRKIAINYLRGWFVIDLIACLPWEQVSSSSSVVVSILRGCKALRLLRLSRLFKFLESHQMVGHAMRMIRMLFFFFLFAHWIACVWYAIGAYHATHSGGLEGWLSALTPPLDPHTSPFDDCYITSLYWVFTTWVTIGYGDIVPKTDYEKIFAMCVMVMGAVIYATIFGNVAILLQSLGRLDNIFKEKMENVNFYMEDLNLPQTLQLRVRNYYTFLWARHKSFSNSNQLEELPASLTNQIAHFLHQDTIEKCSIFKNAEEGFLRGVTTRLKFCVSLPQDYIFKEDDPGDKIYFLRKGRVEIENEEYGLLSILEEGAFFGDISILIPLHGHGESREEVPTVASDLPQHRRKRTASAKSVINSDMYYLLRDEFLGILTLYPSYGQLFLEIAKQRFKQTKVHSDEILVEKILETHAKKGWLKLKGLNKPRPTTIGGVGGGVGSTTPTSSSDSLGRVMNRRTTTIPSLSRINSAATPSASTFRRPTFVSDGKLGTGSATVTRQTLANLVKEAQANSATIGNTTAGATNTTTAPATDPKE